MTIPIISKKTIEKHREVWTKLSKQYGWNIAKKQPCQFYIDKRTKEKIIDSLSFRGLTKDIFTNTGGTKIIEVIIK